MSDPSDPRTILRALEQQARKRFGQHFLTRRDICERMVRAARVAPGDRVVEIGPGLGILTEVLLSAGATVTAVELDRDLAAYLRTFQPQATIEGRLKLVEADAMRVRWEDVAPGDGWKVVANLPYNVGTPLVADLIRDPRFASLTVMLQREVVDRMLADPGSKAYGALTVHLRAYAEASFVLPVPPSSFHPPPKVDSAVVQLVRRPVPEVGPAGPVVFGRVVRASFVHRRKTILNSLQSAYDRDVASQALARAGVDPTARAETLDQSAFVRLSAELTADS